MIWLLHRGTRKFTYCRLGMYWNTLVVVKTGYGNDNRNAAVYNLVGTRYAHRLFDDVWQKRWSLISSNIIYLPYSEEDPLSSVEIIDIHPRHDQARTLSSTRGFVHRTGRLTLVDNKSQYIQHQEPTSSSFVSSWRCQIFVTPRLGWVIKQKKKISVVSICSCCNFVIRYNVELKPYLQCLRSFRL